MIAVDIAAAAAAAAVAAGVPGAAVPGAVVEQRPFVATCPNELVARRKSWLHLFSVGTRWPAWEGEHDDRLPSE